MGDNDTHLMLAALVPPPPPHSALLQPHPAGHMLPANNDPGHAMTCTGTSKQALPAEISVISTTLLRLM